MRFTFNGKDYSLGFQRNTQSVKVMRDGKESTVPSKYPYTTVTLYERTSPSTSGVIAQATVGCIPSDPYSNEKGRLYALRALNQMLFRSQVYDEKFREAMWKAYFTRPTAQPVDWVKFVAALSDTERERLRTALQPTVAVSNPQLALPPASGDKETVH